MRAQWGERWARLPPWARCVLVAYVIGFTDGTGAHVEALARGGLHDYATYGPALAQVFLSCLVVLDPLVVVLLLGLLPAGAWLAAAVMATDVSVNLYDNWGLLATHPQPGDLAGTLAITLFGLLVLTTFVPLRRGLARGAPGPAPVGRAGAAAGEDS